MTLLQNKWTQQFPTCSLFNTQWKICNIWSQLASTLCSRNVRHGLQVLLLFF